MLYPIIEAEKWAQNNSLEIESTTCLGCKQVVKIDVPIASKEFRGFKTQPHGCPKQFDQYNLALKNPSSLGDLQTSHYN